MNQSHGIEMNRLHILQTLMREKNLNHYLEIGVFNAHIFFRIKSNFKTAVDPEFQFDWLRKAGKSILNPTNFFAHYFEKTSDDFFQQDAPELFRKKKIEISLIDGMHEYEFALRDIENTLFYSSENVVIVVHDCNPKAPEAEVPFADWKARNFTGTWNGDVWKAILHLRSLRHDVNAFVLDTDHGLGIITRQKPENRLSYTKEQIGKFRYEDFEANRNSWLNLKRADYFYEYFGLK
jgi:Methyltransferase domain